MATLCIAESRATNLPVAIGAGELLGNASQRAVRSIAPARATAGLREWLGGQWGLIFSHPEDFQESGLEQDRWLTVLAQEFRAADLKPLACLPSTGRPDAGWVSLITGDPSLVPLEGAVADLAARQLRSEIASQDARFVLVVDETLRRRGLLPYRSGHGRLSPLDLIASVTALRRRSVERCAACHDMDSPCSYGISCARLKTVDRSITEQGESRCSLLVAGWTLRSRYFRCMA